MSSELQSGLVICKNFTHIWSKVRHKYIIKKQQQQQKKNNTHEHTEKDKQTSCLFLENSLKLCPYVVSILPSLLGCDNKCKSTVEDEELFKCKPVLVSQMTQEV